MKYIRVNFDIYEVEKEYTTKDSIFGEGKYFEVAGVHYPPIPESTVIEQSDSIVNLCDYVVGKKKIKKIPEVDSLTSVNDDKAISLVVYIRYYKQFELDWIKLAIATDSNIRYVAQVNLETGDVVLL